MEPDPGGSDQQNVDQQLNNRKAYRTVGIELLLYFLFASRFVSSGTPPPLPN